MQFVRELWTQYKLYIISIGLWLLIRNRAGLIQIHVADALFITALVWIFVRDKIRQFRKYKTPQFVSDGSHFSISEPSVQIGYWNVFRIGGIRADGEYSPGEDGICVVPTYATRRLGENVVSMVQTTIVPLSMLPPEVYRYLTDNEDQYNLDTVHYGIIPSTHDGINVERINELISSLDQVRDRNTVLNEKNELIDGKMRTFKKFSSDVEQVSAPFKDASIPEKLQSMIQDLGRRGGPE